MLARGLLLVIVLVGACAPAIRPPTSSPGAMTTCRQAFQRWIDGSASLNSPGADVSQTLVALESMQRHVFELCSLEEAERLNYEIQIEYAPGVRQPMIEPDMRTFADVECVDESPLLDGTRLCAEVGH